MLKIDKNFVLLEKLSTIFLFIVAILNVMFIKTYSETMQIYLGILLLLISFQLFIRHKNDRIYIILFAIILYINISIFLSDCLTKGSLSLPIETLTWQHLRGTVYEIQFFNALNLFLSMLNVIDSFSRKDVDLKKFKLKNKDNQIVFYACLLIMLIGLLTGYKNSSTVSKYTSDTTTLYEYCVLFCLFAWYYAGVKKSHHILIWTYAILYILQALIYGDRSSCFPMILLMIILYFRSMPLHRIIILALSGIITANLIAVYRANYSTSGLLDNYILRYGLKSFTSDTVSQSYYTGVSLCYVRDLITAPIKYFQDFIIGIFVGGDYGNANVIALGKLYTTNKGGGLIISNFYFWFGYMGSIILGGVLGFLIRKLENNKNNFLSIWKIYLTTTVFRWYLYTSFDLFRGCIFVFLVVGFTLYLVDKLTKEIILRKGE